VCVATSPDPSRRNVACDSGDAPEARCLPHRDPGSRKDREDGDTHDVLERRS
jgi:hypothetical protein